MCGVGTRKPAGVRRSYRGCILSYGAIKMYCTCIYSSHADASPGPRNETLAASKKPTEIYRQLGMEKFSPFANNCKYNNTNNALSITRFTMAVFAIKTAGRTVLRKSPFPSRHPNILKRHQHNASRPKPEDDPANGTSIPVPNTVANIPIWQRLGPLSRGFQAYGRSQRRRPYTTQFCSSLVIYVLGDLSAQNINGDEYDPARTLRALVISAGSSIPSYKWSGPSQLAQTRI